MMTTQEIFDKVKDHLLTQGKQALDGTACCYRSPDGLKCAVGCLIPDGLYNPNMEGWDLYNDRIRGALDRAGVNVHGGGSMELLESLQSLHDCNSPDTWMDSLDETAAMYGLDWE